MHPVFEKLDPAIQRVLAKHNFTEPTASRIICKLRVSEDEFYADIFEAERNCVQTLRFWDGYTDSLDLHSLCSHPALTLGQLLDPHLGIVQFLVAES